jgi:CheY-like chemotaxis protein
MTVRTAVKRVLLVEDNLIISRAISLSLRPVRDWQVETAASGMAARIALTKFVPDVVIADVNLGDVDGIELVEELRSESTYCGPVVLLTASSRHTVERRAAEAGICHTLIKPPQLDDLLRALDSALAGH